jgi:hypothetical protein
MLVRTWNLHRRDGTLDVDALGDCKYVAFMNRGKEHLLMFDKYEMHSDIGLHRARLKDITAAGFVKRNPTTGLLECSGFSESLLVRECTTCKARAEDTQAIQLWFAEQTVEA